MIKNQKTLSRFLLLIPIFFILVIIVTAEKNPYHINGSDLNFDLLIFIGKGFFSDPFEPDLLTNTRSYTSIAGNIYQFFFSLPSNYSDLLKIYRIFNIVPFLFFIFYLIKKNNSELNYLFLLIIVVLSIGQFHEHFINFTMKMTAVILFIYYSYILKYKKLYTIKKELSAISFFSVFLYPLTLPAILMMTAVFKIKNFREWPSLILISIPSIILASFIAGYQFNGENTYNSYDPLYGTHNLHFMTWYIKRQLTIYLTFETFLGLAFFIFYLSFLISKDEELMKKLNKYKIFLFKLSFFIYLLYFFLTLIRNFEIQLPYYQYMDYFGMPIGFVWLVIFLSIKISNYLMRNKKILNLNPNFFLLLFVIGYFFSFYQLYSGSQYTENENKYVKNLEKKILENKKNFKNISCKIKIARFEIVHLRLLTNVNVLRPFGITFQNPYSKLDLPKYMKYVPGYSPKNYIFEKDIPNKDILECIKK
ncbi:hypothetical protein N9337_05310 [Candidatus Pelagibacter sp.]|nr:hypothetical protein [Candidatus Pelagibacter sp.]